METVFAWMQETSRCFLPFILRSDTVFGGTLMQSRAWLLSMFQTRMLSAEAAKRYSAFYSLNARWEIAEVSIEVLVIFCIDSKSQNFTVRSVDPFAIVSVWGLNCKQVTDWPGNSKFASSLSAVTSQIFREPSELPEATHLASGDIWSVLMAPECSRNVATFFPARVSQSLTLVSWLPVTRYWSEMLQAIAVFVVRWPLSFKTS